HTTSHGLSRGEIEPWMNIRPIKRMRPVGPAQGCPSRLPIHGHQSIWKDATREWHTPFCETAAPEVLAAICFRKTLQAYFCYF
ncbi:MAG: hypothetical protein VXZ53_06260, partial [Planctomycetota bacterium]|nr:hypothetical protein [Planctomycetota bacterium]